MSINKNSLAGTIKRVFITLISLLIIFNIIYSIDGYISISDIKSNSNKIRADIEKNVSNKYDVPEVNYLEIVTGYINDIKSMLDGKFYDMIYLNLEQKYLGHTDISKEEMVTKLNKILKNGNGIVRYSVNRLDNKTIYSCYIGETGKETSAENIIVIEYEPGIYSFVLD